MAEDASGAQLMLAIEAGEGAMERLAAVMAAVPVASVIVKAGRDQASVEALVRESQKRGAAAVVAGEASLARAVGADGVHLEFTETLREAYETARAVMGGKAIVGGDAGRSKHEAMVLGELGADYVGFGIPSFVKDRQTAAERRLELVDWWAEIFEVPSVGLDVVDAGQARMLADAGADFVCLSLDGGIAVADAVDEAKAWFAAIGADR